VMHLSVWQVPNCTESFMANPILTAAYATWIQLVAARGALLMALIGLAAVGVGWLRANAQKKLVEPGKNAPPTLSGFARIIVWVGWAIMVCGLGLTTTSIIRGPSEDRIKVHAMSFGAILNTANHDEMTVLAPIDNDQKQKYRSLLADWWEISSRKDLLDTLDGMIEGTYGHRAKFEALRRELLNAQPEGYIEKAAAQTHDRNDFERLLVALSYLHAPKTKRPMLTAWDFGRYINVCFWGYLAGYLTEQEAWDRVLPAARYLQSCYSSWDEFAEDYLRGREFWSASANRQDHGRIRETVRKLLSDESSFWNNVPWYESLGKGPMIRDKMAEEMQTAAQNPRVSGH
jgi:hypothetical protein